ncbi:MAG: DUF2490 domain-containing protein, partial [Vicinamibacterales bacterium]
PLAAALVAALVLGRAAPAAADDHTAEVQLWSPTTIVRTVSEKWFVQAETQVRLTENLGKVANSFLRPAVGIRLGGHATLHLGYAWVPYFSPRKDEQRIWEQVSWSVPAGRWTLAPRLRLEQRWLPGAASTTWRLRGQFRASHALTRSGGWRVTMADEVLMFLNDTASGPAAGFGANRVHVGFTRRVNHHLTVEPGYVLQYSRSVAGGRTTTGVVHALLVSTNIAF